MLTQSCSGYICPPGSFATRCFFAGGISSPGAPSIISSALRTIPAPATTGGVPAAPGGLNAGRPGGGGWYPNGCAASRPW